MVCPRAVGTAPQVPLPRASRVLLVLLALMGLMLLAFGVEKRPVDPGWSIKVMWAGGAMAVVFGGAALLRAEARLLVVVTTVPVGIGLFAFNAYLTLREPPYARMNRRIDAAHQADPDFDHRSLLEVVRDLRAEEVPALPYLIGSFALDEDLEPPLLPISGVSTTTTVLCNESGAYTVYESDEHGFNNPAGWPDEVDIVVVGDSFVHGQCVAPGEDIAGQLRRYGYSVLNLGVSGHGPLFELAALLEYGVARAPDAVIWAWSGNDWGNLSYEMGSPVLRRYLAKDGFSQRLADRQDEVDAFWYDYIERKDLLEPRASVPREPTRWTWRGLLTLREVRSLLGLRRGDDSANVTAQLAAILERARSAVREGGGELYFVDLPHWEIATTEQADLGELLVLSVCERTGVPVIEFHRVLLESEDPRSYFPYGLPGHYNQRGYALLAKTIVQAIEDQVSPPAAP